MFETTTEPFTWDANKGIAFASDLGLRPGQWPAHLRVKSTLTGAELVFWWVSDNVQDDDYLLSARYLTTTCGRHIMLEVLND